MNTKYRTLGVWLLLTAALSCSDSPGGPVLPAPVASVRLSPESAKLMRGDTLTINMVARSVDGTILTGRPVEWHTSDPSVAVVNGTGSVTTYGLGTANITAVIESRTSIATVEVMPAVPGDLAGTWRMRSFDGLPLPATHLLFLNAPIGDRIVGRVEFRLDSAMLWQQEDDLYQRRYCFTELHDEAPVARQCWGDHGRTTVGTGSERGRVSLTSDYIQNLSAHGEFKGDVTLHLVEPLEAGESSRQTVWSRE